MIILYHNNQKIVEIANVDKLDEGLLFSTTIAEGISLISQIYENEVLVWCNIKLKEHLNVSKIASFFTHNNLLISFNSSDENFLSKEIGYVDESIFINVNKKVKFPTWQMSSAVGALHTSILKTNLDKLLIDTNFDYFLNSLAKLAMPKGLFCYSEPQLLTGEYQKTANKVSQFKLYKFVKQHYKLRWLFILLFNQLIYDRKLAVLPFFNAFFYKSRRKIQLEFETIEVNNNIKTVIETNIDVIIPTIGRKAYLYDVLCDLRNQTHLPENVIIVEQHPIENSFSELDYLTNEPWPFAIKHTFTHQAGACNARNMALSQVESGWVFFADDDIRFDGEFIGAAIKNMISIGSEVVSFACIQQQEKVPFKNNFQWNSFGSGCSIAKSTSIKQCEFDVGFEFGFGEDADFGMQLRNLGVDICYFPHPHLIHLKAPIGGFRTKPKLLWSEDAIQPKPSPTVMLFNLKHKTMEQLKGYKTILFFKYYKVQKIKNPVSYFFNFKKQWNKSMFWANVLLKKSRDEV